MAENLEQLLGDSMVIFLWTHPRSIATAVELCMRQRGDLTVDVNPFDASYYFAEGRGLFVPKRDSPVTEADTFPARYRRLFGLTAPEGTSGERHVFARAAAYTVLNHLEPELWRMAVHTFVIRDPRYSLPSHRRFVGDKLGMEEAGYEAQHALYRALRDDGQRPIVFDSHDLLRDPEGMLASYCAQVGIPWIPESLRWEAGMRPGWELWPEWKREAAASTGFTPFRGVVVETEKQGEQDPLYPECSRHYEALFRERFTT